MYINVHCIFCIIYIVDHLVVSFRSCYHTSSSPAIVNLSFNHHQFCADNLKVQRKCGPKQSRGHGDWSWRNFFVPDFETKNTDVRLLVENSFDGAVPFWIF